MREENDRAESFLYEDTLLEWISGCQPQGCFSSLIQLNFLIFVILGLYHDVLVVYSLAIIFINKFLITYQKRDEESCVYAKIQFKGNQAEMAQVISG